MFRESASDTADFCNDVFSALPHFICLNPLFNCGVFVHGVSIKKL